jgi:hypothetical protein
MMDRVSDELNIEMNYATADEHVAEAERNNRTTQERIRATYHNYQGTQSLYRKQVDEEEGEYIPFTLRGPKCFHRGSRRMV